MDSIKDSNFFTSFLSVDVMGKWTLSGVAIAIVILCLQRSIRPVILGIDFDQTIVHKDTTLRVVQMALDSPLHSTEAQQEAQRAWDAIAQFYWTESEKVSLAHLQGKSCVAFCMNELESFLDAYHAVDSKSIDMMMERKILYGITEEAIHELSDVVAREVDPDFHFFGYETHIISLNWCQQMVQSVLDFLPQRVQYHVNQLVMENGVSTGELELVMTTPQDKRKKLQELTRNRLFRPLVVYVGDSISDLLAMLQADVGFVMTTQSKTMQQTIVRFGIQMENTKMGSLKHLAAYAQHHRNNGRPVLFQVDNWKELESFLS